MIFAGTLLPTLAAAGQSAAIVSATLAGCADDERSAPVARLRVLPGPLWRIGGAVLDQADY
ncbi:MAG: hypothetical protein U0175_29215 [Caldilineaceae bacterium]